jgi:hypothetical protein
MGGAERRVALPPPPAQRCLRFVGGNVPKSTCHWRRCLGPRPRFPLRGEARSCVFLEGALARASRGALSGWVGPEGWRGECTDPTRGTNTRARGRSHELRAPHTSCAPWLLGRHGGLFERLERGRRRPGGSSSQPRRDPAPARSGCCAGGRHLGRCSSRASFRTVRPQSAATGRGPSVLWG